jgi:hypothetical protein
VPVSPLPAAALVAVCFAIPFGVAALFDSGPEQTPVAVSKRAVQPLDQGDVTVRVPTLRPVPGLPPLREPAAEPTPAPSATTPTQAAAPPSSAPAPAPTPAPAPAPSGGGTTSGGSTGGGSDSFDSTR